MSDTKTPEVKVPEIKQEIRDIAAKLNITIDPKTGTATAPADAYEASLPDGITPSLIKQLNVHNTNFVSGLTLALGEAAIPVMKKNSELATANVEVLDSAGNKFSSSFYRTKLVGAPGGEKSDKFGVTVSGIELKAARKTGQLGNVRAHLSALATKQLASK